MFKELMSNLVSWKPCHAHTQVPLRDDGSNQPSLFRNRPQSFCTTDPRRFSMQTSTTPCVSFFTIQNLPSFQGSFNQRSFLSISLCVQIVNSYAPRHSDPDWKISTLPVQ